MHMIISDIDDSLIFREQIGDKFFYGVNKTIIDMLMQPHDVSHLALMSHVDLSDIDNALNTAATTLDKRKNINYISRHQLITYLQQLSPTLSITTQADPIHKTGIQLNHGAYHAFYMEAYCAAQLGKAQYEQLKHSDIRNNPFKQYNNCVNRINNLPGYDIELAKNTKLADEANQITSSSKRYDAKAATQKYFMFKYIMECLPKGVTRLTYIEDDPICIQAIATLCSTHYPNIRLSVVHIHEPGTPYISLDHLNIKYHCLERSSVSLYVLGTKNYENIVDVINKQKKQHQPALYQANLSFEKMSELVFKEALYIETLLECWPNNKFKQSLAEFYTDRSLETIKTNSNIDPANERKKFIAVLTNLSEENQQTLSKKFTSTEKGFTYASTDQVVFSYLPELLTRHLPQDSTALYNIVCHLFDRLEPYNSSNINDVKQSINNCRPSFWRSNEKQMLEQYPKIILNILEQLISHRYNEHTELNQLHLQQNMQVTPKS